MLIKFKNYNLYVISYCCKCLLSKKLCIESCGEVTLVLIFLYLRFGAKLGYSFIKCYIYLNRTYFYEIKGICYH